MARNPYVTLDHVIGILDPTPVTQEVIDSIGSHFSPGVVDNGALSFHSPNLLTNFDSFEQHYYKNPMGTSYNMISLVLDNKKFHGENSLELTSTGLNAHKYINPYAELGNWILLDSSGYYIFSYYIFTDNDQGSILGSIELTNGSTIVSVPFDGIKDSDGWVRKFAKFYIATPLECTIKINITNSGDKIYLDALQLEKSEGIYPSAFGPGGMTVINGGNITTGIIDAEKVEVKNLNADNITTGTLDAAVITVNNLDADNITTGTLDASVIAVTNLNASNITTGTIDASIITVDNLDAGNITTGTLDAALIDVVNLNASNITAGEISGEFITGQTISSDKFLTTSYNKITSYDSFEPFEVGYDILGASSNIASAKITDTKAFHGKKSLELKVTSAASAYKNIYGPTGGNNWMRADNGTKFMVSYYLTSSYDIAPVTGNIKVYTQTDVLLITLPYSVQLSTGWTRVYGSFDLVTLTEENNAGYTVVEINNLPVGQSLYIDGIQAEDITGMSPTLPQPFASGNIKILGSSIFAGSITSADAVFQNAAIVAADIGTVNADTINSGSIKTNVIKLYDAENPSTSILRIENNNISIYEPVNETTYEERLLLGSFVKDDTTYYGLRISNPSGQVILDSTGITQNAFAQPNLVPSESLISVDGAKLTGEVPGNLIAARSIIANQMVTGTITAASGIINDLSANVINTGILKSSGDYSKINLDTGYVSLGNGRLLFDPATENVNKAITVTNYIGNGTNLVTCTFSGSNIYSAGDIITITGASGTQQSKLNGIWIINATNSTTFTFYITSTLTAGTYTTNLGTTTVKSVSSLQITDPYSKFSVELKSSALNFKDKDNVTAYVNGNEFNIQFGTIQKYLKVSHHKMENMYRASDSQNILVFRWID